MRFRDAAISDIRQMRHLQQASPSAANWSESQYRSLFDSSGASRIARVAEDDSGMFLGFLIAHPISDEWEIENVIVDSTARRSGVGLSLLRDVIGIARSLGAKSLLLEVRESNAPASGLYEKIGFNREGRRKDYYQNPPEDALLYRLSLQFCDKIP